MTGALHLLDRVHFDSRFSFTLSFVFRLKCHLVFVTFQASKVLQFKYHKIIAE